jgi:hypothetical protein
MAKSQTDTHSNEPDVSDLVEESLVAVETSHMPVHSGEEMVQALDAYMELQGKLDARMPDAIQMIQGKPFRKKMYWRTIARAFNLSVGKIEGSEQKVVEGEDWGYIVQYRAIAPNGAYADGDGACMASEKPEKMATVHNVRAHAHTRAFTRATSNLVAFGEVGADECQEADYDDAPYSAEQPAAKQSAPSQHTTQDLADGKVRVTEVFAGKSGTSAMGPWTMWVVKFSDGRSGTTFAKELKEYAESCLKREVEVKPSLDTSPKGVNVTKIEEVQEAAVSEEEKVEEITADDIPF